MSTENEVIIEGNTPPPAENWGDPNAPDIMAAMDKFFGQEDPIKETPPPAPVEPAAKETPPEPVEKTPKEEVKLPENDLPEFDDDYFPDSLETPSESKEEVKSEGFDEAAFDKQTEEEVKGMEAKAGEKFRALKAELKEAKKTTLTPDIQAKLKELELKTAEVDGLKQRMVELSGESAKLQIENDDDYKNQVVKPAATLFSKSDELAEAVGVDPQLLRSIIRERDLQVQEGLMEEHFGNKSLLIQSKVAAMAEGFNSLLAKREEMLNDAELRIEKNRIARAEAEKKMLNDQRVAVQSIQKSMWEEHKELIPGLLDEDGEETDTYKKLVARGLAIDFGKARAKDQARAALSGTVLPHALRQIRELQNQLAVYQKDDKKKVRSSPSAGSSVNPTPINQTPATFEEAMAADYDFTG
jgi:hypothetical protein